MSNNPIVFNLAAYKALTLTEGIGRRFAIWFQGCLINCPGCCNPEMQPFVAKKLITIDDLVSLIKQSQLDHQIEGVTFLGGEPTHQKHLDLLAKSIQALGLGVILFSGRLKKHIDPALLAHVDLLIDGMFIESRLDQDRNMIGSTNQVIHVLTPRYLHQLHWFQSRRKQRVEIAFDQHQGHLSGDVVI